MAEALEIKERESVVVRFSGDSGDGMQLAGNIFSTVSATVGNSISTFPDYPADIRAPQGSLTGVSGFQVHLSINMRNLEPPLSSIRIALGQKICRRQPSNPKTIWEKWGLILTALSHAL